MNYQNLENDKKIKELDEKIENKEFSSKEELEAYLNNMKDKGILTKAQVNLKYGECLKNYEGKNHNGSNRMMSRTPQRNDLNDGSSAGFSNMNFLVLNLLTLSLVAAMIVLLNK